MVVRIVTDSASDLPQARADELGIEIVPLTIRFGDEEFVDRVELTNEEFWRKVATSPVLPETAAPAPGAFEERFRALAAAGADAVVCINLSSRLSGTMQSAQLAATNVAAEIPVRVLDSGSVSLGLGSQCIAAQALATDGADLDTIAEAVTERAAHTRLFGALDTLEHLRRGGRIGGAQALLGSVLSIKPIISISDGVVHEAGKVRTRSKSLVHLAQKLADATNPTGVFVFHAQAPDIEEFLDQLGKIVPRESIEVGNIGPVIGTHGGPRTMGLGWVEAD